MNKYRCGCNLTPKQFFLEADYVADPIWCAKCRQNLDMDDFSTPKKLREKLIKWVKYFNKNFDFEKASNEQDQQFIEEYNRLGYVLATELEVVLGDGNVVDFVPLKKTNNAPTPWIIK